MASQMVNSHTNAAPAVAVPANAVALVAVRVCAAKGIMAADSNGLSDPYAVVSVSGARRRTSTKPETLSPDWSEDSSASFVFALLPGGRATCLRGGVDDSTADAARAVGKTVAGAVKGIGKLVMRGAKGAGTLVSVKSGAESKAQQTLDGGVEAGQPRGAGSSSWVVEVASAVVEVELWDSDYGSVFNPDDFLGSVQVPLSAACSASQQWFAVGPKPGKARGNIKGNVCLRCACVAGDGATAAELLKSVGHGVPRGDGLIARLPSDAASAAQSSPSLVAPSRRASTASTSTSSAVRKQSLSPEDEQRQLEQMVKVVEAERRQKERRQQAAARARVAADAYQRQRSGR